MQIKSPWLALLLAIIHALSGLTILLISAWFIAACAVAGVGFNYLIPAVIIRALALIRISSGYAEMWVGHNHLLTLLAKLRLNLFSQMKNQPALSSGTEADKLTFQTEAVASIWAGWITQNASAWLAMTTLTVFTVWQLPTFSGLWLSFIFASFMIYFYLIFSSLQLAKTQLLMRENLECDIEHYVNCAPIWHMYKKITHPNALSFYHNNHKIHSYQARALRLMLIISLLAIGYVFTVIKSAQMFAPIVLVLPMAMLAAPDWFGRVFSSQIRLLEYINSSKALNQKTQAPVKHRLADKIITLNLTNFSADGAKHPPVSLSLARHQTVLLQGSSGVGKSRLLQAINGLLPYNGVREVNGKITQAILDDCLYVEQQPYCLSASVRDNLTLADNNASDAKLLETLTQLNLNQLNNLAQWIGNKGRLLSGGELKRLGLARAMLSNASIILLDEPFEGLDRSNMAKVVGMINYLAKSKCIVIASHILPENLTITISLNLDKKAANVNNVSSCTNNTTSNTVNY